MESAHYTSALWETGAAALWPMLSAGRLLLLEIGLALAAALVAWTARLARPAALGAAMPMLALGYALIAACSVLLALAAVAPQGRALLVLGLLRSVVEVLCLCFVIAQRGPVRMRDHAQALLALALAVALVPVLSQATDPSTAPGAQASLHLVFGAIALGAGAYRIRDAGGRRVGGLWLTAACLLTGAGELAAGASALDGAADSGWGALLKLFAYAALCRAIRLVGIGRPQQGPHDADMDMDVDVDVDVDTAPSTQPPAVDSVLSLVPIAVLKLDCALRVSYANAVQARRLGLPLDRIIGMPLSRMPLARHYDKELQQYAQDALGGLVQTLYARADGGGERASKLQFAPARSDTGEILGVWVFTLDVAWELVARDRMDALVQENSYIREALDAHAIVAVTDARGVINEVNDKFCEISQYDRSALIGKTHRVVNSRYHPPQFFRELWRTISSGRVWNGEICNRARDGSHYWVQTTIVPFLGPDGRPTQYVSIRADITGRKMAELAALRLAHTDGLTGLENRRAITEKLEAMVSGAGPQGCYAVMFIDLDHFKKINDTLGHDTGDRLLSSVARRLRACVRSTDVVARMGGDEFLLCLNGLGPDVHAAQRHVAAIGADLLRVLSEPHRLGHHDVVSTPSIGVYLLDDKAQACSVSSLLKGADLALFEAKNAGGAEIRFFNDALMAKVQAQRDVESDLACALDRGQLHVHYQCIVDERRRVVGWEALLRWVHPTRGLVSPADFIAVAERTGEIQRIGFWVLEQVGRQLEAWSHDPATAAWTISINVSARQLYEREFSAHVLEVLARTGADSARLCMEITESLLLEDMESAIRTMQELRQRSRIRFALDDFGTGYSSLSYLQRLPISVVKIDRCFIRDIEGNSKSQAIVHSIVQLAIGLKLRVITEGVETLSQFDLLQELGCRQFQGFFFGKPLPIAQQCAIAEVPRLAP